MRQTRGHRAEMKPIDSISVFGEVSERDKTREMLDSERDKIREMLDEALKRYKTKTKDSL